MKTKINPKAIFNKAYKDSTWVLPGVGWKFKRTITVFLSKVLINFCSGVFYMFAESTRVYRESCL